MNDKFVLPLYFTPNRRWSKINICDLKWLITFLLVLSTLAIYILFINLPSDFKAQKIQEIFIPDVHDHEKEHNQQHPEPPHDDRVPPPKPEPPKQEATKKKDPVKEITTIKDDGKSKLEDENTMRREKIKEVFHVLKCLFYFLTQKIQLSR